MFVEENTNWSSIRNWQTTAYVKLLCFEELRKRFQLHRASPTCVLQLRCLELIARALRYP